MDLHLNGYCGWTGSDLGVRTLGLSNADVQISSGESSSGSRAGNLVLELKAELKNQWADLLSWMRMAFMQEKEKSWESPGRGGSSLHSSQSSWPQRMAFLSAVSIWCSAYVPTMALAPAGLLKAGDPKCRARREMLQPLDLWKGN